MGIVKYCELQMKTKGWFMYNWVLKSVLGDQKWFGTTWFPENYVVPIKFFKTPGSYN